MHVCNNRGASLSIEQLQSSGLARWLLTYSHIITKYEKADLDKVVQKAHYCFSEQMIPYITVIIYEQYYCHVLN